MSEILASALLYLCPFAVFLSPCLSGLLLFVALSIPPRQRRASLDPSTRQDLEMPLWEFDEVHETSVKTNALAAFEAVLETTADEIFLYQTLTGIRRFFGTGGVAAGHSILRAAGDRPILESAEQGGFERLISDPGQELLMAANLGESIRVTMNFTFPEGRVRTETRVHATNWRSRWLFAWYWRAIYPGSSLIRYMWLRAIRLRAQRD